MRSYVLLAACAWLVCAPAFSTATRTGDEDFGADTTGRFYAFANKAIQVINPVTLSVDTNITQDQAGNPLTNAANSSRGWNDATFGQDKKSGARYVIVNEADAYTENGGSTQYGYVTAINASSQSIVARLRVGARPVHIYFVNATSTIWSHSDAEGTFYLIPLNSTQNLTVATKVPAFVNVPAHGKLVVNEALYPIGYGSNVGEPIMPKFNLSNNTRIANVQFNTSLPNATSCTGTHTIVYSRVNKHIYAECVGDGGVLEWNTVNDTFVKLHSDALGVITGTPADDLIIVADSASSQSVLLQPGANGQPSTILTNLAIPYNPNYPTFYNNDSSLLTPDNFTKYTVYFPLTRNTNINNIKAVGADTVTTPSYMVKPSDCTYADTVAASSVSSSASGLKLASSSSPSCGACAPGINSSDPTQFNASLSGFGVLDMSTLSSGKNATTSLLPAGATLPAQNKAATANQCSFTTEASRAIKRGGAYIATVADFPQSSIYILDASKSGSSPSYVRTAEHPTKIAWVPAQAT